MSEDRLADRVWGLRSTWYKTTDGCFVTEWDIIDGNCRSPQRQHGPCVPGIVYSSLETSSVAYVCPPPHLDTSVLSYCGDVAETYTQGPSSTVFNTECNIIPEFVREPADHTKMYTPEVDLTVTCSTNDGDAVLGNTYVYVEVV